ncbi:MAG: hypothetical protein GX859_09900 [Corynebacterium humireducens]|jgi:hypothetical protein|uniref:DUF294 domain-containing protein n=1 Tax=Corynebacterium humireducens TaxID=1223514 RepID=A0A7X6SWY6_9CORY|nr:hypothetical protein [Corynebacterium humireducens]
MLHQSLRDLAEQAPLSTSTATARGVLCEAQQLLRNALDHRTPETALTGWFSGVVRDTLRCPAVASTVTLTGAHARGDALPSSPVEWFGEDAALAELLRSAGLEVGGDAAVTDAARIDAGLVPSPTPQLPLLELAVAHRPPALQITDGLPDPDMPVDIPATLLQPISDVARWAAPGTRSTLDRLSAGLEAGVLTEDEVEALAQAWETALALQFRRWADRVEKQDVTLGDLPALHRSAYGATARMVAGVLRSLAGRHGVALA